MFCFALHLCFLHSCFSSISLHCFVSPCPDIDFVDSPMGLALCSFLQLSMIIKGLVFLGFPRFVLESQRAWGLPMAGVLCVSLLVRDSPFAGIFFLRFAMILKGLMFLGFHSVSLILPLACFLVFCKCFARQGFVPVKSLGRQCREPYFFIHETTASKVL